MPIELTPEQIANYKAQGYSDSDIQEARAELEQEERNNSQSPLQQSYNRAMQGQQMMANPTPSYFPNINQDNLIKWQLELDSILERTEHMLRGDKPKFQNGNLIWIPASNDKERILNEMGVAEIMRILSMYINRNTILSNYDEKTIGFKVYDFGCEVSDFMFLRYDSVGLDDLNKRKLYPIMIRELVDIVHSAYLRALNGGERESLREARQVQQSEAMGQGMGMQVKERGILNPMRWVKGRY